MTFGDFKNLTFDNLVGMKIVAIISCLILHVATSRKKN
jgi:hypothetical protein